MHLEETHFDPTESCEKPKSYPGFGITKVEYGPDGIMALHYQTYGDLIMCVAIGTVIQYKLPWKAEKQKGTVSNLTAPRPDDHCVHVIPHGMDLAPDRIKLSEIVLTK